MQKTSELKPCPFCGGEAKIKRHSEIASSYYVACTNCPTDVGRMWYWKRQDAINAWNRRSTETDTPCGAWKACWDSIKEVQKGADNENALRDQEGAGVLQQYGRWLYGMPV